MGKRLKVSLIGGSILGVICIVGAYTRSGFNASPEFVFSLWYNRVMIGLVIGAPWPRLSKKQELIRGGFFGLVISFAFYSSTGFIDTISFIAGMVYGVILEGWLMRYDSI